MFRVRIHKTNRQAAATPAAILASILFLVGGVLANRQYNNGDFYLVATKTVTRIKGLPLIFNLGYKATNASVFGLAGKIRPGVNLEVRHQFAFGNSFGL